MKRIIIDLDNTLCHTQGADYANAEPALEMIQRLREYQADGFEIVIHTSRNMRTFAGNVGRINAVTLPIIIDWLRRHDVPHDEIIVGKPWCGHEGFYVDDRAIRPAEFLKLSFAQVEALLELTP